MNKLTKIEVKTINVAVRTGFAFSMDSHFTGYLSARRTINKLIRMGYLKREDSDYGTCYVPTEAARDFVEYGITI
jgi:hypothetical protein